MSKEKKFVASEKTIEMTKGGLQWNKSTKEFRDAIGKCYITTLDKNNAVLTERANIARYQGLIESNNAIIASGRFQRGKIAADYQVEIDQWNEKIENAQAIIDGASENLRDDEKVIIDTYIPRNMHTAFTDSFSDSMQADINWRRAMMEFLDGIGVAPTEKGLKAIDKLMGGRRAGGKAIFNGKGFIAPISKGTFNKNLIGWVFDEMEKSNCLKRSEYSWTYVPEEKNA